MTLSLRRWLLGEIWSVRYDRMNVRYEYAVRRVVLQAKSGACSDSPST